MENNDNSYIKELIFYKKDSHNKVIEIEAGPIRTHGYFFENKCKLDLDMGTIKFRFTIGQMIKVTYNDEYNNSFIIKVPENGLINLEEKLKD